MLTALCSTDESTDQRRDAKLDADFRIDGPDESTELSAEQLAELSLFAKPDLGSHSGQSTTEDSEDSYRAAGSATTLAKSTSLLEQQRRAGEAEATVKGLNDKIKLLLKERANNQDTISAQKRELTSLRSADGSPLHANEVVAMRAQISRLESQLEAQGARAAEEHKAQQRRNDHLEQELERAKKEVTRTRAEVDAANDALQRAQREAAQAAVSSAVGDEARALGAQTLALQEQVSTLRAELSAARRHGDTLEGTVEEKDHSIRSLEARLERTTAEMDAKQRTLDALNVTVSRLQAGTFSAAETTSSSSASGSGGAARQTSFDLGLDTLDAALQDIGMTPSGEVAALQAKVAQRDREIAQLSSTVARLEKLAFEERSRASSTSEAGEAEGERRELLQAIAAQESHIGSLKEEVALLTRQLEDKRGGGAESAAVASLREEVNQLRRQLNEAQGGGDNNAINNEKQKKVAAQQRAEGLRLAQQQEKLERDRAEFVRHLAGFKEQRREVLGGTAVVTAGAGVPKARYRQLRVKRDKYKRKDYRKGKDINSMQKRLLQNVELLEVEDSQTSDDSGSGAGSGPRSGEDRSVSAATEGNASVQVVHDTSSEADSAD